MFINTYFVPSEHSIKTKRLAKTFSKKPNVTVNSLII